MENKTILKKLAVKGTAILFVKHLLSFLINLTGGIVLARYFGPKIMGLYFVSYACFTVTRELIDWGTQISFIRKDHTPNEYEIRVAFTLQQVVGIFLVLLAVFIISPLAILIYKEKIIYGLVLSSVAGAYFYSFIRIPTALYERDLDYIKISAIEISEILAFNLTAILLLVFKFEVLSLVTANVVRGIVPAIFVFLLRKQFPKLLTDFAAIKNYARSNLSILGANISFFLTIMAPPLVVGSIAGPAALGISQVAYSILNQTGILSTILSRVFLAFLSKVKEDKQMFISYVNKIFESVSIIYIFLMFGVACLSPFWVPIVYGSKWAGVENIMILGSLPAAQLSILMVFYSAVMAAGKTKIIFFQSFSGAVIYWAMMFLFVIMGFKEYSIPMAHLFSVQAAIMLLYHVHKNIGDIRWLGTTVFFIISYAFSLAVWLLLYLKLYSLTWILVLMFLAFLYMYLKNKKQTYINIYYLVRNRV